MTTPSNPLQVTNITAKCKNLKIGDNSAVSDGRVVGLRIGKDGVLNVNTNENWNDDSFTIGHLAEGHGVVIADDGEINSSILSVGYNGSGIITNNGCKINTPRIRIGLGEGSIGVWVQNGGIITNGISMAFSWSDLCAKIGNGGDGTFIYNGGTVYPNLWVGWGANSHGKLIVNNPLQVGGDSCRWSSTMYVGNEGAGEVEAKANVELGWLKIGSKYAKSSYTIYENATNIFMSQASAINIGDYYDNDNVEHLGNGEFVMRGGALLFQGVPYNAQSTNVFVRRFGGESGIIRGWGMVQYNRNDSQMIQNGQVIADGEGVDGRRLNLRYLTYVYNTISNGWDGTNGWYAVNKGVLMYPRLYCNQPVITRSFGDSTNAEPTLVNSVTANVQLKGSSNVTLLGYLFAPDSSEIYAGLPEEPNGKMIGAWGFNSVYSWNNLGQNMPQSVRFTFRYDHTKVGKRTWLKLYNYSNGAWNLVKKEEPGEKPVIASEAITEKMDSTYNLGQWALFAVQRKMFSLVIR